MLCAQLQTVYAYADASATSLVSFDTVAVVPSVEPCAVSEYVVMTSEQFAQFGLSPFALTTDEAGAIAGAILLLWATAYGIRMAIQTLRKTDEPTE